MTENKGAHVLARFNGRLKDALHLYESEDDGGRSGAICAIAAAVEFVRSNESGLNKSLARPLTAALLALSELDNGVVVPLLKTVRRLGPEPQSEARQALIAYAVLVHERLWESGLSHQQSAARSRKRSTIVA